jgi:hypothetical protein
MITALAFQEPLHSWLDAKPAAASLPGPLPQGFPVQFGERLQDLAKHPEVSTEALTHLYFDLVLCPQIQASLRRMRPSSRDAAETASGDAIFLDPHFSWPQHIDERLEQRWRECLLRHHEERWLSQSVALLSSFRVLAEHLH